MTAERWQEVCAVFAAVIAAPLDRREDELGRRCAADEELRAEVRRLLDRDAEAARDGFLTPPQWDQAGSTLGPGVAATLARDDARVVCPHCGSPVELTEARLLEKATCAVCGSSFRLERDQDRRSHGDPGRGIRTVGRFELIERVGAGSFGTVYRARDTQLDRIVAVKLLRIGMLAGEGERARFLREARASAQLRHPSIVSVHEVGEHEGFPFLVSDFIQGSTLSAWIRQRTLAVRESAALVATLADALHYAHEHKVIHRDVKPSNVMIDEQGRPHLMDFGLARRDAGEVTMTLDGELLGTPAFMSPEQARGEGHRVDGRSDVYSLGVVLYQLLTNELPFRGNARMMIHQVIHDDPRHPRSLNDRIPRDLDTIAQRAMAKEPSRRYASAALLADDLRRYLEGLPILARRTTRLERAWRWCRRNPWLALAIGSSSAALIMTVLYLLQNLAVLKKELKDESTLRHGLVRLEQTQQRAISRAAGEPAAWDDVRVEARSLEAALQSSSIDPALRDDALGKIRRVLERVDGERDFRRLLDDLERIRVGQRAKGDAATAIAFARAFRGRRIEPSRPEAKVVLNALLDGRSPAQRDAMASYLEAWAMVERQRGNRSPLCRDLIELVRLIDPVPARVEVRAAWLENDRERLIELAGSASTDQIGPNSLVMLASWQEAAGDKAGAVDLYKRALIAFPHDVWLNYDLATILKGMDGRSRPEAETYYRIARALRPATGHDLAHLLQESDRMSEAESIFRELSKLVPDNPQHLVCLAVLRTIRGAPDEALHLYEDAVKVAEAQVTVVPEDSSAHLVLANALAGSRRSDAALEEFRRALACEPAAPEARLDLANLLLDLERFAESADEYRIALDADPRNADARVNLGLALRGAGRLPEAIAQLGEVIRSDRADGMAYIHLGDTLSKAERIGEAIAAYREGLARKPREVAAWVNLADRLRQSEREDEAVAAYRKALELDPGQTEARFNLADALRHETRNGEAIVEYRTALLRRPGAASARFNLASLLEIDGESDAAIAEYRRALADDPGNLAGRYSLADLLRRSGQFSAAIAEYRRALRDQPGNPAAHTSLALCLREICRFDESIAEYQIAIDLRRDDPAGVAAIEADLGWCRTLSVLSRRLPGVLDGKDKPGHPTESVEFAKMAFHRGDAAASARLWDAAFSADPALGLDKERGYLDLAARAAALAGSVSSPGDRAEQAMWRGKAITWLSRYRAIQQQVFLDDPPGTRKAVRQRLRSIREARELAAIREPSALASLSLGERSACRALWSDVDLTLMDLAFPADPMAP